MYVQPREPIRGLRRRGVHTALGCDASADHSGPAGYGEIGESPTTTSQHLAKLRWGKIVEARQEGNRAFYRLIDEHARELVTHAVFQAQHVVGSAPLHHRSADGSITADPQTPGDAR